MRATPRAVSSWRKKWSPRTMTSGTPAAAATISNRSGGTKDRSPASTAPEEVVIGEAERVEGGDVVAVHPLLVVRLGRLRLFGAAVAPQVDADGVEGAAGGEAAGDRIEEPGAEPVGMEEHDGPGPGRAAP